MQSQKSAAPVQEEKIEPVKEVKQAVPVQQPKKIEPAPAKFIQDSVDNNYMPVKAMNTFTKDWIIKARISSRSDLKTTKKGGYLMKIELVDHLGTQIEGTFFNDAAQHFDTLLVEDRVYLFSNGTVKMANKKFTSLQNDFCIVFEKHANI